jgi:D-galacturonate reductase
MRYVPDQRGYFAGQQGYGYRSMEAFVTSLKEIDSGDSTVAEIESSGILATAANTIPTTAILEAGRRSLNEGGRPIRIIYGLNGIATNFE